MKLPLNIAKKLIAMIQDGAIVPSSSMPHVLVKKMVEDGVLQKKQTGRRTALLFISNTAAMKVYLHNNFGINDLSEYINILSGDQFSRSEAVSISGNSKLSVARTFKGFLVNSFSPVATTLNGVPLVIEPADGSFTFIYDYESFAPSRTVTIVGLENPENFRYAAQQRNLFKGIDPLFVSRYPYSNDLLKWLQMIPNKYLHFGDLDFAGISIFQNEYKKHLGDKASFFIPGDIEDLLVKFGNRSLYNIQLAKVSTTSIDDEEISNLLNLFHKHKCVLEQEIFIKSRE